MKYEIELGAENIDMIRVVTEYDEDSLKMCHVPVKPIKEESKVPKRWRANKNENYYYIIASGEVRCDVELGTIFDNMTYKFGNYYKTRKQAEFASERQKVLNKLEMYSVKDTSEIDKENGFYTLVCMLDDESNDPIKVSHFYNSGDQFMFASRENAEAAINAIGKERLKKYFFKVKED